MPRTAIALLVASLACSSPAGREQALMRSDPMRSGENAIQHFLVALADADVTADHLTAWFGVEPSCDHVAARPNSGSRWAMKFARDFGAHTCTWEAPACPLWAWDGVQWVRAQTTVGCSLQCSISNFGRSLRCLPDIESG